MLRLLNIEWNKIYYYKTTRIFTILYFLILVLVGVVLAYIKLNVGGVKLDLSKLGMFTFPVVWNSVPYIVAILKIFIAVIIITSITNEFSNRTLKQNLIDGLSKKEFLQSKMLTNFIFAFASTVFVLGITLVLGNALSGSKENVFKGVEFIFAYFLKLNFFFTFCMFLSILFRKSAFALLAILVWWMLEGAFSAADFFIKAYMNDGLENVDFSAFFVTNYLPLNASSKLIEFPQVDLNGFVMGGSAFKFREMNWQFMAVVVAYTIVFTYLSYWLLKRRDL